MRLRLTAGLLMLAAIGATPALAAQRQAGLAEIGAALLGMASTEKAGNDNRTTRTELRTLPPLMRLALASFDQAGDMPVLASTSAVRRQAACPRQRAVFVCVLPQPASPTRGP